MTNAAVLTETSHLLEGIGTAQTDVLTWISRAVRVDSDTTTDLPRILELMTKYADLPADFADASLIALAERIDTAAIATFDSDFKVYRVKGRRKFQIIFEA